MSERSSFANGHVYERITTEIITAIEAGASDFQMPWHRSGVAGLPKNASTNARYYGINVLSLWARSALSGYASRCWATYLEWQEIGAQVRQGEKGSLVVFYKFADDERDTASDDLFPSSRKAVLAQVSHVFNEAQIKGWQSEPEEGHGSATHLKIVDDFIGGLRADVRFGGKIAAYNPQEDCILMPERNRFHDTSTRTATEAFYSTLLHEYVHWTGHESRLNRDLTGSPGDRAYAIEELHAEIGAAFLSGLLSISVEPRRDHAAYINEWLSVLRDDKTAIISAAKEATDASDYLLRLATTKVRQGINVCTRPDQCWCSTWGAGICRRSFCISIYEKGAAIAVRAAPRESNRGTLMHTGTAPT